MIKAVVFDFDGLILDTETPWYHVYYEICKEHGVEISLPEWAATVGTTFDPFAFLEQRSQAEIDRPKLAKRAREMHAALLHNQSIRPGVEEYLQAAKERQLKIGLASSSGRSWVEGFLKRYGLFGYFECIRTGDDVEKVKPDPELYRQALAHLGVKGAEAIAFEDSLNGLKAAKGAGLHCVIVPNAVTSCLPFANYDLRIQSMADIDLPTLISRLEK